MTQSISESFRVSFLNSVDISAESHDGLEEEFANSSNRDGSYRLSSIDVLAHFDDNHVMSPHQMAASMAARVKEDFRESLPETLLIDYAKRDCIGPFKTHEIKLGRLLGSGEFSNVYEIKSFRPDASVDNSASDQEIKTRHYMISRQQYRDTKKATYALKHLRPGLIDKYTPIQYSQFATDLVREAEFLSVLQHPNIIKLRGVSLFDSSGFIHGPKGYFLIIDRLDETLVDRIAKWKRGPQKGRFDLLQSSVSYAVNKTAKKKDPDSNENELLHEQLEVMLQIAAAIVYLHDKNIIFRDLKPANVGFDVRGDAKLFDFGLAKILRKDGDPYKDSYKMSCAGTPRYMSPEMLSGKTGYNLKTDVYTFSVVLWEVLSLERPFSFIRNKRALIDHILMEEGRLDIKHEWPATIKDTLKKSFGTPEARPTMRIIFEGIRSELCHLRNGDTSKLRDSFLLRRRTITSTRNLVQVECARRSPTKLNESVRATLASSISKLGRQLSK